ncbi:MAG: hypothetical protein U0X92_17380 [Anaerolineales bacterium]
MFRRRNPWRPSCAKRCPELPSHIHVIGALDKINTYDLIEIANLGLAYTTTVGVETAMNGIPVISCGQTHYRERAASRWM